MLGVGKGQWRLLLPGFPEQAGRAVLWGTQPQHPSLLPVPGLAVRTPPSLFNSPGPLLATRKQYLEVKWVSGYVKEGWWIARALSGP